MAARNPGVKPIENAVRNQDFFETHHKINIFQHDQTQESSTCLETFLGVFFALAMASEKVFPYTEEM